jgi:RNA-directed DNA polymerase
MRRVMEPSNPDVHLLERVLSRENMQRAWKRVRANKGAPGIDGMTIEEFPELARQNWDAIRESLLAGTYQPSPVRRVEIPKDTGGTRPLGIPIVLDRLTFLKQLADYERSRSLILLGSNAENGEMVVP